MFKRFIIVLAFTISHFCFGQSITIEGKIIDTNGKPITNANIIISTVKESNIIKFDTTDDNGVFKIQFKTPENSIEIKITHLGFVKFTEVIALKNSAIIYNQTLIENQLNLNEVVIAQQKIRDTMRINTKNMKLTERSTLRNILDKTEGFAVSKDGGISFRGKKIEKILVNKKEVFVNQNKIALDNMEYGMMENLDLINNYKDQFDVNFDNVTSSVININTKKNFKGVQKWYVDAALGYKDKYIAKIRRLYFSDKLNTFFTNNNNNIGEKAFSFKDISSSFKIQSSSFFNENLTSFFSEDDLLNKAFDSNTSLTVRNEKSKNRLGFVFYFNNMDASKTTFNTTENNKNELLKNEETINRDRGNAVSANFGWAHIFKKDNIFFLKSDFSYNSNQLSNQNTIQNFMTINNSIFENNIEKPKSLLIANVLKIKTKFLQKNIMELGVAHNFECSKQDFHSSINTNSLTQKYSFENNYYKVFANLDRRLTNHTWVTFAINSTLFNESLNYKQNDKRTGNITVTEIKYGGQQGNNFTFEFNFVPKLYYINSTIINKAQTEIKLLGQLEYNFTQNTKAGFEYYQNTKLLDLHKNIDTLLIAYNYRLINKESVKEVLTKNKDLTVFYDYSSMVKTKHLNLTYNYSIAENIFQPVFESITNNVFYYQNKIIDKKETSKFSLSADKGFYITKSYHLLKIEGDYNYVISKSPTFSSLTEKKYKTQENNFSTSVGIEPKNFFLDEIYLKANYTNQDIFLDDSKLNNYNSLTYALEINKKKNNFEFNFSIGKKINKTGDFTFESPFLNINSTLKLNDKTSFFFKGKYLFHLFNFPNTNFTDLNIVSDGNLIYNNFNKNNLAYLVFGLNYKF